MMILGGFQFKLDTLSYQNLNRTTKQNWGMSKRFGQHLMQQYLGKDEDAFDLSGVLLPTFKGDPNSLDQLRDMADEGEPYMLVSGYGKVFGLHTILSITDNRQIFFDDGANMKFDFKINIRKYVK